MQGRLALPMRMGDYHRVQWPRARGQAGVVLIDNGFYRQDAVETSEEPPIGPHGAIGVDLEIVKAASTSDGEGFSGEL